MNTIIVVPSLKISGGIREVLRLRTELDRDGHSSGILSLWTSPHAMTSDPSVTHLSSWAPHVACAPVHLPILAYRFAQWWRRAGRGASAIVFTHYVTLPLALLTPRKQRFFFVQDLEWNFIGTELLSRLLRRLILAIYRTGRIISANAYLSERLTKEGMHVAIEAPIWADPGFNAADAPTQDVDFAMVLRKGAHKRLDLYLRFIELARGSQLRVAVVTPEDAIVTLVREQVAEVLLRPTHEEMRSLYARSTCFIHLSEHEGFGLPPLEAMGAGCIPVCRDSGGVRAFMSEGHFADLLLPLTMSIEDVFAKAASVATNRPRSKYRAAARDSFSQGLTRAEHARNGLAAKLSVILDAANSH